MLQDISVARGGNKTSKIIVAVVVIVAVIIIVAAIMQIYKSSKQSGEAAGEIIGAEIVAQKTGISAERQSVCRSVAQNIEKGITRIPITGWKVMVDDQVVVDQLNRLVSPAEAALASTIFKQLSGDSLKSVVEGGYMTEQYRKRITLRDHLV